MSYAKKKDDKVPVKDSKKPMKPPLIGNNSVNQNYHSNSKTRISSAANNQKRSENGDHQDHNQKLLMLVKDYLLKSGYVRAFDTLKNEKAIKKITKPDTFQESNMVSLFDKGLRDDFFKVFTKQFAQMLQQQSAKKLEFELNIYFYIYAIHPQIKKSTSIDRASVQYFKKYLETRGSDLSKTNQFLSFYALPYIQKPQQHPAISYIFTKQWLQRLRARLTEFITTHSKNGFQSHKRTTSALQQMYEEYCTNIKQCKTQCSHQIELQQLQQQNAQLINYLESMQTHYKTFTQSAKANLLESQAKWFQFAKQILVVCKKAIKGDKVDGKLQKYEQFLSNNVQDLISAPNDVSLFERNSYLTQQVSINPNMDRPSMIKKNQNLVCPIDLNRIIKRLYDQSEKQQKEVQMCLLLQALRWRFTKLKNPYARRQVIISYSVIDLCGVKKQNWKLQEKLIFKAPLKVRECFLRLLNYMTSDYFAITYLSQEEYLIGNMIKILKTEKQQTPLRRHSLGVIQKFSLLKRPQNIMVNLDIVEVVVGMLKHDQEIMTQYTLEYTTALIMNLSLRKVGKERLSKYRKDLLDLMYDLILIDNNQIRNYVNGTLYSFISSYQEFKEEAAKMGFEQRLRDQMEVCEEGLFRRQFQYIIQKLNSDDFDEEDVYSDDEENELDFDDIEQTQENVFSEDDKDSEYLDEEEHLTGEQLLMKQYALLGPDGIKQQFMTKSILDETSMRKQNLTTSINKSRRGDVFAQRPVTPSLNGIDPQLSKSMLKFNKIKNQTLD